ncbi:MAG: multiheme c-type cytochrome [Flavobacteriales bacterium]|nr:multiheme c-type cytochrome [Flavobacteriales bacterium]
MRKVVVFFFSILLFACQRGEVSTYTKYLNHNDTVKYVGKQQCRACHGEIYDSYMQTGMGKSFHFATKEHSALANSDMPLIDDSIKNLSYQPFWKNDSLYLKEFRLKGKDTSHLLIKKVNYKIGSGQHTNSHLFEINGYVHQMPYTYYTQDSIADLPPGFEKGNNTRFSREIGLECMSCHNAYPNHVESSLNKYEGIPSGIDCERCHGPGEVHVKQNLAGNIIDTSKYIDYSIVNPGKLPMDLQFDVCQRCHLQGTAVLAEGKNFTDFKPGQHLEEVMDVYLPKYENEESFIMASHVDRLKESSCFKISDEMTCITCHDPHKSVSTLSASYFDNKCMQCHDVCEEEETQNCTSCHMPTSSSTDIMHVAITDHKIGVHTERETKKGAFKGLVAINNTSPTDLSKAKAYLKHYESFEANPIYLDSAKYYLDKLSVEKSYPLYVQYYYLQENFKDIVNLSMQHLGIQYLESNKSDKALCLSRIAESFAFFNLDEQALSHFQQASKLAPYQLDYQLKLGVQLVKMKDYPYSTKVFKSILSEYPLHKQALVNLGYLSILNEDFSVAENYLKQAIALDPDYLQAYENLVLLAQMQNKIEQVKAYLNKILEIAPGHKAKQLLEKL